MSAYKASPPHGKCTSRTALTRADDCTSQDCLGWPFPPKCSELFPLAPTFFHLYWKLTLETYIGNLHSLFCLFIVVVKSGIWVYMMKDIRGTPRPTQF